jgi:transposase
MSANLVAPANQLFKWRRLVAQGALMAAGSGEEAVPASDYRALQSQVRDLARCARAAGRQIKAIP